MKRRHVFPMTARQRLAKGYTQLKNTEDNRSLAIGIVSVANLPQGTGRTGRLRTLAGALAGLGHRVTIWNEHAIEKTGGQQVSGDVCGAHFEYVLGTTDRLWGFRSIALKLRAVRRIGERVRQASSKGALDVLIFNHLAFYDIFPLTRLAKRLGVPTIQCYEDERRELVGDAKLSQRVFGCNSWMADHWCSSMADQIWVISSYLKRKYTRLSGKPDDVFIIPTIVDCLEWNLPAERDNYPPVLLYAGSFAEQDDLQRLVEALFVLRRRGVRFRMRFLGAEDSNARIKRLKCTLRNMDLQDSIEFLGFQRSEVVKNEIAAANILINLRTDSLWSRSGLSTKLSEYLASARTVLLTDVGDNAQYVRNGESAIVVEPGASPETIAIELEAVITQPALRKKLAAGARQAAFRHFDVPVVQNLITRALERLPKPFAAQAK